MATIKAGFDVFETSGEAYFTIPSGFGIPGGFFHKDSQPWTGLMTFTGYPVRKFEDPRTGKVFDTGAADTFVERKQDVTIQKVPGTGSSPIQLVKLRLRSCRPIEVQVGRVVQRWDVEVDVSQTKPSSGTITITQTSDQGGTFNSELTIWPLFKFVHRTTGEERLLDMGALRIPAEKQAVVASVNTLVAAEVPFTLAPAADTFALPELTGNFAAAIIAHHSHLIGPVKTLLQ